MNVKELKDLLKDVPDNYEVRFEYFTGFDCDDCEEWENDPLVVNINHEYEEVNFSPQY